MSEDDAAGQKPQAQDEPQTNGIVPSLQLETVPLDSLLSPQASAFAKPAPSPFNLARASVAESDFNDVALDDEAQFDNVALSARVSAFNAIPALYETDPRGRPRSISVSSPNAPTKLHRKSLSVSASPMELPNMAFMVTGADSVSGAPSSARSTNFTTNRGSLEGQQQLQDEFARLQEQRKKTEEEERAGIDWGVFY
jgi:ecotropic viral integration site 5 protein